MDNKRKEAYINFIHQLLNSPSGEEAKILEANQELVDEGLLEIMELCAQQQLAENDDEKAQNAANFLRSLRSQLVELLEIAEFSRLNFLVEVLRATIQSKSKGDSNVVYQLLQQNLDKLDDNFADILRNWATARFSEVEAGEAEYIAVAIINFSNRIQKFPLGSKANNMEISIAGYEVALEVFTHKSRREIWARTQSNLGYAYWDRIRGDKAQNIEDAIYAYQQALLVYTQTDFPIYWAMTQNHLGNAYSDRIKEDKAQNIEDAIYAYQQALQVYTDTDFPSEWAMTQNNLGSAYTQRIKEDKAQNIEQAIKACKKALQVYNETDFPSEWAMTQNNLGSAYRDKMIGDKDQNIEQAIKAYKKALQGYAETGFSFEWAMTHNNLGIAYSDRIRGDKAQNIEDAIDAYKEALQACTQTDFPIDWARTQNNLGNAYRDRIIGDKAQNIEAAITAFQQALLVYTRETFPEEWAAVQYNIGKLLVHQGKWYDGLDHLEQALAFYRQTEDLEFRADIIYQIARTHHLMSNLDKARIHYRDALRIYEHINNPGGIATCKTALGRLMISIGYIDDALQELNQAREIYDKINHKQGTENTQELVQFINNIRKKQSI